MDLPQELEDFIKESIDHSLGLPVSEKTLSLKLQASYESQRRLRQQYNQLVSKLNQKDLIIQQSRAEACMNAQALKKFVQENQRLAAECTELLTQCNKLEGECSLYDHDREALMDFGNEADERAKEAEIRACKLAEELEMLREELKLFKRKREMNCLVDSSAESIDNEEVLLESVLSTVVSKDEVIAGHDFLKGNSGHEPCQKLLKMWNSGRLKPTTQKAISLVAEVKTIENDKEHLRINLNRAEEEAKLLYEENKMLDLENKKLLRQHHNNLHGSGGKHSCSASAKKNKRKSSPRTSSPVEKIDFGEMDSVRHPLSPLKCNSSDSRIY